jgi:hypothetical protein
LPSSESFTNNILDKEFMHRIIRNSQQTGNKSAAKNLPLKYRRKNN